MVGPEPCKELRRRISAANYAWDRPSLTFICQRVLIKVPTTQAKLNQEKKLHGDEGWGEIPCGSTEPRTFPQHPDSRCHRSPASSASQSTAAKGSRPPVKLKLISTGTNHTRSNARVKGTRRTVDTSWDHRLESSWIVLFFTCLCCLFNNNNDNKTFGPPAGKTIHKLGPPPLSWAKSFLSSLAHPWGKRPQSFSGTNA